MHYGLELLNLIQENFETLEIFDEGEFWETNDINLLKEHWENFYIAMAEAIEENKELQGPFKLENGRIVDLM